MVKRVRSAPHRPGRQHPQAGFTYLGVLFALALIGIGLAAISEVWTTNADRQKVAQVNWIGQQYVNAIGSYYYANTGSVHFYPTSVNDLLEDKRYLGVKRHLRSRYEQPIGAVTPSVSIIFGKADGVNGVEISVKLSDKVATQKFMFVPEAVPTLKGL